MEAKMTRKVQFEYEEYQNIDQLTSADGALFRQAMAAASEAYAPYSRFLVGTALLLEDGQIILGNNQENAAYPLCLCAERVAFFAAGANHKGKKILKAAIYARSLNHVLDQVVSPCGACRQAMVEYEQNQGSKIELIMGAEKSPVIRVPSVTDLLPLVFGKEALG